LIWKREGAASLRCEPATLPVSLPEAGLSLEEVEKELILRALQKHDWNQSRAARYLGITRHTLLYRMDKHGIQRPGSRGPGRRNGAERRGLSVVPWAARREYRGAAIALVFLQPLFQNALNYQRYQRCLGLLEELYCNWQNDNFV
jgi:hypothetical protein